MISMDAVLTAIEGLIGSKYHGETFYKDLVPKDFERPSFLLEGGPIKAETVCSGLTELQVVVTVTCFVAVDDYHNSHTAELVNRLIGVMGLLGDGCIEVQDRHPHITALEGDYEFDFATVKATLSYSEQRPEGEGCPIMGEIQTKIKEK